MTYKELLEKLNALPPERLDDDVTIVDGLDDEVIPVIGSGISGVASPFDEDVSDVLDKGHFYLLI